VKGDTLRLRRDDAFLLIVDVQQKLAPHVDQHERVIRKCLALVRAAKLLGMPLLISEHCPDRIGSTVPSLLGVVSPNEVFKKTHFSCADEPSGLSKVTALDRKQAVVAGMEAHVCVMQSVLGLAERGFQPFVVADAVGSRNDVDRATAIERMGAAGCSIVTAEMTIFEWMYRADIPEFRDLLAVVKSA
jgi:nicotinamidase-related amidase